MSDLQEVIARWRKQCSGVAPYGSVVIADSVERITRILDAAEAAEKARDAALEEAAQVAERLNEQQDNWLYPRRQIAFEIRALKARTA